jgi:glycosyltransferase involved in cell wall biosynthesis
MPGKSPSDVLRIGIDYTAAARETAGIGRYARELIHAVLNLDHTHTYKLIAGAGGLGANWQHQKSQLQELMPTGRLSIHALPITDDWMARVWQRLRLPLPAEFITGRIDLFYSPNFVLPPLLPGTRSLLTIHDLSFIRYPAAFTDSLLTYLQKAVPRSVHRATHLLADSEATRQDLITLFGTPPNKVTTLLLGVSPRFSPVGEANERSCLQNRYGIGSKPYVLSLGTVQPRKNYVRLMQALDPIAVKMDMDLVIAGRHAWLSEPILEQAAQRPFVHMLGFTDDGDLPALYRQAALFAFPSLYEGFGLPPLEAMACGTPVIASNASSIPEAVGQAGLLVDPLDVPAWTQAVRQVFEDTALRDDMTVKGLAHSSEFTWQRSAQKWLSVVSKITS